MVFARPEPFPFSLTMKLHASRMYYFIKTQISMKRVTSSFRQIFTAASGRLSSKRVCGFMGWVTVLGINIYCTLNHTEAPEITEVVCIVSASLMGIGVIEPYFRSKGRTRPRHHEDPEYISEEP